jgi:hypothetical protein
MQELGDPSLRGVAGVTLSGPQELDHVLRVGLSRPYAGELCVHDGTSLGRIYLFEQRVAWAHCTTHAEHLGAVLHRRIDLDPAELQSVVAYCRESGARFGEALVDRGLLQPPQLRACLREHIGNHLAHVMAMQGDLTAWFQVRTHRYDHRFTFALEELHEIVDPRVNADDEQALVRACESALEEAMLIAIVEQDGRPVCIGNCAGCDATARQNLLAASARLPTQRRAIDDEPEHSASVVILAAHDALLLAQRIQVEPMRVLAIAITAHANIGAVLGRIRRLVKQYQGRKQA